MEKSDIFNIYGLSDIKMENPLDLKLHLRKCLESEDIGCDDEVVHHYMVSRDQECWSSCRRSCTFCNKSFSLEEFTAHQDVCPFKGKERSPHKYYQPHLQNGYVSKESLLHTLESASNAYNGEPEENYRAKFIEEAFEAIYQEIMHITKDIGKLRDENNKLKDSLDIFKKEKADTKASFNLIFKRLDEVSKYDNKLSIEVQELNKTMKELKANGEKTSEVINEIRHKFEIINNDNQKVNSENYTLKHLIEQALEESTKNRDEIKRINEIYDDSMKQITNLKENIGRVKDSQMKIERDAGSAKEDSSKLNESMELIKSDSLSIKFEIRLLKDSIEAAIKSINEQVSNNTNCIKDFKDNIMKVKEENLRIQDSIVIFQKLISKADEHYGNLIENINSTLSELPIVRKENEQLRLSMEEANRINREVEDDQSKLKMSLFSIKKETKEIRIQFKDLISREKNSLYNYLSKQHAFNAEIRDRICQIEKHVNFKQRSQITEGQMDVSVGSIVAVENKTLDDLSESIKRHLFGSSKDDRCVAQINSRLDPECKADKDLGLQSINGAVYRCKLKQGVQGSNKETQVVLYLYQVAKAHSWPPPGSDKALWCIVDPLSRMNVVCYQVAKAKLSNEPPARLKYKYFSWRALEMELLQKLKSKLGIKRLYSSFIIYKKPSYH